MTQVKFELCHWWLYDTCNLYIYTIFEFTFTGYNQRSYSCGWGIWRWAVFLRNIGILVKIRFFFISLGIHIQCIYNWSDLYVRVPAEAFTLRFFFWERKTPMKINFFSDVLGVFNALALEIDLSLSLRSPLFLWGYFYVCGYFFYSNLISFLE